MNRNKFLKTLSAVCISTLLISCGQKKEQKPLRLLYWNIQNGMWCGQDDNYEKFTTWVKQQDPIFAYGVRLKASIKMVLRILWIPKNVFW